MTNVVNKSILKIKQDNAFRFYKKIKLVNQKILMRKSSGTQQREANQLKK